MGGKLPPGAKVAPEPQPLNTKKEEKKEDKKQKENKKKWERCEDRCPGDPWAYCIVLWCACAMSLISSGYSLYKQQGLQDRLSLLEEQHLALRSAVLEPQQPLLDRLRREVLSRPPPSYWRPRRSIRDYGDCVCPAATKTSRDEFTNGVNETLSAGDYTKAVTDTTFDSLKLPVGMGAPARRELSLQEIIENVPRYGYETDIVFYSLYSL
ncbi:unnamed protein product [Chilo suppressalis]|uniref:Uncharacterized protein n=1 Tax=Chilo suppressalis TaxID=168631 RepID=A0ABN8B094_CHISP|nr:unnamed protein product [Chilo suppressalis]